MRALVIGIGIMAAGLALSGCGTDPIERTGSGAAIGAGGGAAIGAMFGGIGALPGALIGAAVGGTTGAATSPYSVDLGEPVWE